MRSVGLMILAALLVVTAGVEAVHAAVQELRPEDRAAIEAGPVFTPLTVPPRLANRDEVIQAMMRNYPVELRNAGIGGRVVVWYYISETGRVLHSRISESSGSSQLDDAALRVASVYRFTPVLDLDGGGPIPAWIQLPVTFRVQN